MVVMKWENYAILLERVLFHVRMASTAKSLSFLFPLSKCVKSQRCKSCTKISKYDALYP